MAIAHDSSTDGGNATATSLTFSHACSGANRVLLVGVVGDVTAGADDVVGVTYAGDPMTLIRKTTDANGNRFAYLYVLTNPDSGTNNVVVTASTSHFLGAGATSYTGAKQTGQPDASNSQTSVANPVGSSVSTTVDNCWTVLLEQNYGADQPATAGTGTTRRTFDGTFGTWTMCDSNGAITPAGSTSLQTSRSTATSFTSHIIVALAPAVAGDPDPGPTERRIRRVLFVRTRRPARRRR